MTEIVSFDNKAQAWVASCGCKWEWHGKLKGWNTDYKPGDFVFTPCRSSIHECALPDRKEER